MMQYAARLRASGLHAQRERGAAGDAGLDRRAAAALAVAETLATVGQADDRRTSERHQLRLVVVAERRERRSGSARDLVRPPRRVAAGDDDARGGIVARDAADGLPRALIGASPSPSRC